MSLRELWLQANKQDREQLLVLAGLSEADMRRYTRPNPADRPKPSQRRFDALFAAIDQLRPGCMSRPQLAAHFYEQISDGGHSEPLRNSDVA